MLGAYRENMRRGSRLKSRGLTNNRGPTTHTEAKKRSWIRQGYSAIFSRDINIDGIHRQGRNMVAIRKVVGIVFAIRVHALLSCGQVDNAFNAAVPPVDGSDGHWYFESLNVTKSPTSPGSSSLTAVDITFNLRSALDNSTLSCEGHDTVSNPNSGRVNGTCIYPGGDMGEVDTTFAFGLEMDSRSYSYPLFIDQTFLCSPPSPNQRP
jgi:hypothetical protein